MSHAKWDYDGDGKSDLVIVRDMGPRYNAPLGPHVLDLEGYVLMRSGDRESPIPDSPHFGAGSPLVLPSFATMGVFNGAAAPIYRDLVTGTWGLWGASGQTSGPATILTTGASSLAYDLVGAADLDGDGQSELVFRNGATGDWGYMSVVVGGAETWHGLGATSTDYTAIGLGDLNGDGVDEVAFRSTTTGDWGYMSVVQTSGGPVQQWHAVGPSSTAYTAIGVGDFNGDGVDDLAFRNNATGDWGYMALSRSGAGEQWIPAGPSSTVYSAVAVGDYDGDGRADVAFRNPTTGAYGYMSIMPGAGEVWHSLAGPIATFVQVGVVHQGSGPDVVLARDAAGELYSLILDPFAGRYQSLHWTEIGPSSTDYAAIGVADFNHDGVGDLAFRNNSTGDLGYMSVNPAGGEAWHAIGPTAPNYTAYGVGDFNRDGTSDILFRNDLTGDWGYMSVNPGGGETWHGVGPSSPDYAVIGIGNFDGNGMEVAFRSKTTGDWGYMSLDGPLGYTWHAVGATSTAYDAIAVGDFGRDGRDDILFTDHQLNTIQNMGYMSVAASGQEVWHDAGFLSPYTSVVPGDFDGDGYVDLGVISSTDPGSWGFVTFGNSLAPPTHLPGQADLLL